MSDQGKYFLTLCCASPVELSVGYTCYCWQCGKRGDLEAEDNVSEVEKRIHDIVRARLIDD